MYLLLFDSYCHLNVQLFIPCFPHEKGKKGRYVSRGLGRKQSTPDEIQKELDEGVPYRVKGTFGKPQGLLRHSELATVGSLGPSLGLLGAGILKEGLPSKGWGHGGMLHNRCVEHRGMEGQYWPHTPLALNPPSLVPNPLKPNGQGSQGVGPIVLTP